MLFRRREEKKTPFAEFVVRLRAAGFTTAEKGGGRVLVSRSGFAAVIADGGDAPKVVERAGIQSGGEIATLVDGGFQKFFQTPSGVRRPALAEVLTGLHTFQEDLRETLGITSLYNESLGSVSNVYLYDRVENRDSGHAKNPWEIKF